MAPRRVEVILFPKRPRPVRPATGDAHTDPAYSRTVEFRPDFATEDDRPTEPRTPLPDGLREELATRRAGAAPGRGRRTKSKETPAAGLPKQKAKRDRRRRITLEIDTDPALRYHVRKLDELLGSASPTEPLRSMTRHQLAEMSLFGHQLFEAGRLEEARVVFEGLVGLELKDAFPHTMLGTVYLALGRTDRAAALFDAALALDPKDLAAQVYRAELRLSLGELRPAVQVLEAVVARGPPEEPFVARAGRLLEIARRGRKRG